MTTDFETVTSKDGTTIAYVKTGSGPVVVLVGGAFCDRGFAGDLTGFLKNDFTVVNYDRRGRGDSTDTSPYAVAREVEDLAAVVDAVGVSAHAFGVSSGAILILHAAASGLPLTKLALVEPPFKPGMVNYAEEYTRLCSEGRNGDAVEVFMTKVVGGPASAVDQARQSPMWPALEAMAPTLAYDATITNDGNIPVEFATITAPTLAIESNASPDWLRNATQAIAQTVPNGTHIALPGQFHQPDPETMAGELKRFYR
ncbi:alpha/beta hydrolase [Rhizocola hellebori]|uniref:Alpha/beta hydrolase n=1 Tax=Rhizocola hellebori TaxID=1392758 RepID=A0A8J3Q4P0_9ACTN|nr:alpha/beta hydrolase [Rhizocola hellebori]GIH03277.1 alpha/beta hydrolase [Rhizocola hellebori]